VHGVVGARRVPPAGTPKTTGWKVLKAKLNDAETRLQGALREMVKEVFLKMTGWVEAELTEAVGWKKKGDTGGMPPRAGDRMSF